MSALGRLDAASFGGKLILELRFCWSSNLIID